MKVEKTIIEGVYIVTPKTFGDNRGWFMESYSANRYKEYGIMADFVQDDHSFNAQKGTLRGLHFQLNPKAQAKLVRVIRGAMIDVVVDIRKGSPTYKNGYQWNYQQKIRNKYICREVWHMDMLHLLIM